ncbi:MAG: lamin tail domain-containing protein [Bacteroidetes bacterium]|nr:lamin tail domain-containing protein [Bacteroidota bacterium]
MLRVRVMILCFLAALPCLAQVEINELHPTPVAGEPEWVEIVNVSTKNVRLRDWWLCDARTCVRLDDVSLAPHAYAVITRDTAALREVRTLDVDVVLIEVRAPSLNNTTDKIVLRDADSVRVDSVAYTMAWGRKGISLERSLDADRQTRWMASASADSATCGYLNSTVRLQRDLRIADLRIDAHAMSVDVVIENYGLQAMPSVMCTCTSNGRVVRRQRIDALPSDGSAVIRLPAVDLRADTARDSVDVKAVLDVEDDRAANDVRRRTIVLPPVIGSIAINEVLFDPLPQQCDYVEIYNGTGRPVDLEGWMICDAGTEGGRDTLVVSETVIVPADSCGVIAVDTVVHGMQTDDAWSRTFPHRRAVSFNLNASGDDVVLLNPSGFVIDSVRVDAAWHSPILASRKGVALERLSPMLTSTSAASWTSSAAQRGGTPGTKNSISVRVDTSADVTAAPSPFSTNAANAAYPCVISWSVPYQQCALFVQIFRPDGLLVRDLLNNAFGGAVGAVAWDGRDTEGMAVQPGQYIVSVLAVDANTTKSQRALAVVVVGE